MVKVASKLGDWLLYGFMGLLYVTPVAAVVSPFVVGNEPKPTCETYTVPYAVKRVSNPDAYIGEESTVAPGKDGVMKRCTLDGKIVSNSTVTSPVHQVVSVGTKEKPVPKPYVAPVYTQPTGGGAICRDGWRSYSTGRGTCSHHGGVAQWL